MRARDKVIDPCFEGAQPGADGVTPEGNPTLLKELIRNPVDNAINYRPSSALRRHGQSGERATGQQPAGFTLCDSF